MPPDRNNLRFPPQHVGRSTHPDRHRHAGQPRRSLPPPRPRHRHPSSPPQAPRPGRSFSSLPSSSSPIDSYVTASAIRSAPSPDAALSLFRALRSHSASSLTRSVVFALATQLANSRRLDDLHSLIAEIDAGTLPGMSAPLPSPMDRLRWFAAASDIESALQEWKRIRASAAVWKHNHLRTQSYNHVINLCVDLGMDAEAVRFFRRMLEEGVSPDSKTFCVIIYHLVRAGELDVALEVFDRLPIMRMRRTLKQYSVLAAEFSSSGRFDRLRKLMAVMKKDGIFPSGAVRSAIVTMRRVGLVEGTEDFAHELSWDDMIGYVMRDEGSSSDKEEDDPEKANVACRSTRSGAQLIRWFEADDLASALSDWDAEVNALEGANFVWNSILVCQLLRGFKKAGTAWKFFSWVAYQPGGFKHDHYTISEMIMILARSGHDGLVDQLVDKVKKEGIVLPFSAIWVVIDFYGLSKRPEAALSIYENRNSICGNISDAEKMLLCSSLLRTLTKCWRGDDAIVTLEDAISDGILPDLQTFSGLIEFFANEECMRAVNKLFGMVNQCGVTPDAYLYQVLIQCCIKHNRTALALRMFEDMRKSDFVPDEQTKSLLVNSLRKKGMRKEMASVQERCGEVKEGIPVAFPGHAWTISSSDLTWAYNVYHNGIQKHAK